MRRLDEATAATVAGELDDLDAISSCCCYLIDACKRVRDFERASQWCEHVKGFCEQWSDRLTFAACRAHYADILIWRGEWSQAEAELRANLGPLADIHPNRIADGMVRLAELRRRQGQLDEAARLLEAAGGHFLAPLVRAALALDRGDTAAAAHEAERSLRRLSTEGVTDRAPALEIIVRARLANDEPEAAQHAAAELRAIAASAGTAASAAAASFAEGLLAASSADWEPARLAFEDAVDLYARAGGRWEAAHARRNLARALRALGHDEAAEREARAADEALRGLGAGAAGPDAAAAPAGLTARELEVLRLIARGRSNHEIATELVLSVRTVERHIANIYDKIGASGRAARAAAASYALAAGVA
jgi:DNA-binding NarL/FixJ family response regulator